MWVLDCEESWAPKNRCFWTAVLEKTLESPLDCKEIQPVHSEGDQPWDFFERNDAKAETPVLWPPHVKGWLIGKDSDAGKDWGQEDKGTTEDEMSGWHHWLDRCESEWTPGVDDGQGGLACWDSWGRKESDTTERLNWSELMARWKRGLIWVFVWQLYLSFSCHQYIWYSGYTPEDSKNKRKVMLLLNSDIGTVHFIVVQRYCTFNKLKVCGSPHSSNSIFPICVFVSILVICAVFQSFSLLLHGDLWSVVFDVITTTSCMLTVFGNKIFLN